MHIKNDAQKNKWLHSINTTQNTKTPPHLTTNSWKGQKHDTITGKWEQMALKKKSERFRSEKE